MSRRMSTIQSDWSLAMVHGLWDSQRVVMLGQAWPEYNSLLQAAYDSKAQGSCRRTFSGALLNGRSAMLCVRSNECHAFVTAVHR